MTNKATESKAEAMSLFAETRPEFLANARWVAYKIGQRKGSVTIDDVRAEIKLPSFINAKVLGAVFNQKDHNGEPMWDRIGYTITKIKSSHGRPISVWRHRDWKSKQENLF